VVTCPPITTNGITQIMQGFFIWARPALLAVSLLCASNAAQAQIVALGASNTAGKGVGSEQAFPAQLEALLRAKGYGVHVVNAGVNGDTTAGMLARLDSTVPDGTRLVILDQAPANDLEHGLMGQHAANVAAIVGRLRARHIKTIVIPNMHVWGGQHLQPDGLHLTAEGHAAVAARLLPLVAAAIGKR
jgi:acyl-CoA thioesterase I